MTNKITNSIEVIRVLRDEEYTEGDPTIQFIPLDLQGTGKICETVKSHCHPFILEKEPGAIGPQYFISCMTHQEFEQSKIVSPVTQLNLANPLINAFAIDRNDFLMLCQLLNIDVMHVDHFEYNDQWKLEL